jgi:hypothetical protein
MHQNEYARLKRSLRQVTAVHDFPPSLLGPADFRLTCCANSVEFVRESNAEKHAATMVGGSACSPSLLPTVMKVTLCHRPLRERWPSWG